MATRKAATKKTTRTAKSQPAKTTVTTVKAVETPRTVSRNGLGDRRTVLAAALIGEFVGAFLLTAAYLVTQGEPLYIGFVLITLVLMVGTLSGAYLNPLVTVGAWVTRKLTHLRAVSYIAAQLLGAGAAFVVLTAFIGAAHTDASASNAFAQQSPELFKLAPLTDKNQWYVFFAELLGATVFAFGYAAAWRERTDRVARAFTIGFSFFVGLLIATVAAKYASAQVAVNPAAALAASAIDWGKINWVGVASYLVAPLIGGILGFALRDVVETK